MDGGRVQFMDCWTYSDAVTRGTQAAKEVLWMNDDILLIKPCGWEDFKIARHMGGISIAKARRMLDSGTAYEKGFGRAALALVRHGIEEPLSFSTHTPYLYEADKAMEVFEKFGVWHKIPLETLYHNFHKTPAEPIGDFKTRDFPDATATVLNLCEEIGDQTKSAIMDEFPQKAGYELRPVPRGA
jgi:hypothetical protein